MTPLRPYGRILAIFFACLCLLRNYAFAQDKPKVQFGKVSTSDFSTPSSAIIDSNTNAVILSDIGSVHFVGNKNSWFSYVFKRQTRIKILNKKAFGLATVRMQLYAGNDDVEKVDNLAGSTFNQENGQVTETKLDKKDIFEERQNKYFIEKKFTMPAVREGSIIEYTYTITSPYDERLPHWEFQSKANPCLWSEYEVIIPQALFYVFVRQGVHPFDTDKGSEGNANYTLSTKPGFMGDPAGTMTVSARTVNHRWAMKDIPAFHVEHYLTSPNNYIDKIDFQLSKTYNGAEFHDYMNSWAQATEDLLKRENFGGPLNDEREDLNVLADKISTSETDVLSIARAVYYFVGSHFTCTNLDYGYIETNFRDVVKKNSGTVGDINLLLIALLRKKGFQADPVLLSTRDHGYNLSSYPVLSKLNYVIARLKVDGKVYYLDAAHPQLGFGQLTGNCYNGHARIISNKDSGSVYFLSDSLRERKTTLVMISATGKGLEGTYQSTQGQQESYNTRETVSRTGEADFFKNIQTSYGEDFEINNTGIDSLKRPEDPVKIYYDFILKQSTGASLIYFNPLFAEAWKENPFKAADRKYPVEMPYVMDNVYVFSMEVPDGYVVDEMPKSTKVSFNGDQGLFEYLVDHQGGTIQLRCHVKLNKSVFSPEDYGSLRDFFAYVVKKESEQIVLKKK